MRASSRAIRRPLVDATSELAIRNALRARLRRPLHPRAAGLEALVHRAALTFAVLGFSLAACVGPFHPSLERGALLAERAAALRMPGAAEVAHFGAETHEWDAEITEHELTVEGPAFAFDT